MINPIIYNYIVQKLDHFDNSQHSPTFRQRYLINKTFCNSTHPQSHVLILGDFFGSPETSFQNSRIASIAEKTHSQMIWIEHRGVGNSQFPADTNLSVSMTIEQIIADVGLLIDKIQADFKSRILIYGSGYAGSLGAWFQSKYPQYDTYLLADNAPLVAENDLTDADVYESDILQKYSEGCFQRVQSLLKEIASIVLSLDIGDIHRLFGIPFDTNPASTFSIIMRAFDMLFSTNDQFLSSLCSTSLDMDKFASIITAGMDQRGISMVELDPLWPTENNTDIKAVSRRMQSFVSCNQLGWNIVGGYHSLRPSYMINSSYATDICQELFGLETRKERGGFNFYYGGNKAIVKNAIFTTTTDSIYRSLFLAKNDIFPPDGINMYSIGMEDDVLKYVSRWMSDECSQQCVYGTCVLGDQCKCMSGYHGSFCENADVNVKIYNTFTMLFSTFFFLCLSGIGWYLFVHKTGYFKNPM